MSSSSTIFISLSFQETQSPTISRLSFAIPLARDRGGAAAVLRADAFLLLSSPPTLWCQQLPYEVGASETRDYVTFPRSFLSFSPYSLPSPSIPSFPYHHFLMPPPPRPQEEQPRPCGGLKRARNASGMAGPPHRKNGGEERPLTYDSASTSSPSSSSCLPHCVVLRGGERRRRRRRRRRRKRRHLARTTRRRRQIGWRKRGKKEGDK